MDTRPDLYLILRFLCVPLDEAHVPLVVRVPHFENHCTRLFWSQFSFFIFELFYKCIDINDIMVLLMDCDTGLVEMDNIITILILFGKYHIHKAKCLLNVPNGKLFSIDLRIFYESLTSIQNNRKAIKTSQVLKRIIDVID